QECPVCLCDSQRCPHDLGIASPLPILGCIGRQTAYLRNIIGTHVQIHGLAACCRFLRHHAVTACALTRTFARLEPYQRCPLFGFNPSDFNVSAIVSIAVPADLRDRMRSMVRRSPLRSPYGFLPSQEPVLVRIRCRAPASFATIITRSYSAMAPMTCRTSLRDGSSLHKSGSIVETRVTPRRCRSRSIVS